MKQFILYLVLLCMACPALADYSPGDVAKFKNDKEVIISTFSKKHQKRILRLPDLEERSARLSRVFSKTMLNFLNSENRRCDLRLINELKTAIAPNKDIELEEFRDFLMILRVKHEIDDIFFEILYSNAEVYFGLQKLELKKKAGNVSGSTETLLENNDIEELFSSVKSTPDENESCLLSEYIHIFDNIFGKNGQPSQSTKDFRKLLKVAFDKGLVNLETYHKFTYLAAKTKIHERDIWLNDYFKIIFNAKNKMVPVKNSYKVKNINLEDDFASERIKRFSKITRRRLLYRKYNETQIVLLAQLLQKASRRMGSDPDTETKAPVITQEFIILNADGERENYVETIELDPQSQYNLARRLLRKDMTELQMMDIFVKREISHEDIVMAALETGYVSLGDLEFVVKYDDLWNPEVSKFEKVSGFIFRIAGYGSFFLPPPWNVTATIALGIAEGIVNNKNKTGAENDNPATFIE